MAGACAVGMRPVHLSVDEESGSVVYGRHDRWDGETVGSLAEVLVLLDD